MELARHDDDDAAASAVPHFQDRLPSHVTSPFDFMIQRGVVVVAEKDSFRPKRTRPVDSNQLVFNR